MQSGKEKQGNETFIILTISTFAYNTVYNTVYELHSKNDLREHVQVKLMDQYIKRVLGKNCFLS